MNHLMGLKHLNLFSVLSLVFFVILFQLELNPIACENCVSVIVTGSAAKDGRAILLKNRDAGDRMNQPVYYPSDGDGTYAYVMVDSYWMGINEVGLAVMNTLVGILQFGGVGWNNGELNAWIVKHCATVDEVCFELNSSDSPIGPWKRFGGTCVGVIDRFGKGAFIEISGVEAYARFIVDGYDSQANHPRHYPGYAFWPSGRDQYALDIMDEIYAQKGFISCEDVVQNVSRYVRHKEQGDSCFSIAGEMCGSTQAAMVALSGDPRFDGKLNCMWGEYGQPPLIGLFVPSIAHAGESPLVLEDFWKEVSKKQSYAHGLCGSDYDSFRVREIQSYSFFAEDYTFYKYNEVLNNISEENTIDELKTYLQDFINDSVFVATNIYVEETVYDIDFDGQTNMSDIAFAVQAFGSKIGEPSWIFLADINSDGKINMKDIASFARNFGMSYVNS